MTHKLSMLWLKYLLKGSRSSLMFLVLPTVIIALGCMPLGRGTYQIELFSEMHYSQSYSSQEPPRFYPASGAVPFVSSGQESIFVIEPESLERTNQTLIAGKQLFEVNCAVCHGTTGRGDGSMKDFLIKWQGIPPADVTGPAAIAASDDELKGFIGYGGRIAYIGGIDWETSPSAMPVFNKLLNDDEQWAIIHHIRILQGQQ